MDNKWSDKLRKRMDFHEEVPPPNLWTDIEKSIHKSSNLISCNSKKGTYWVKRIMAVVALFLFFLCMGYLMWNKNLLFVQPELVDMVPKYNEEKNRDTNDKVIQDTKDLYFADNITDSKQKQHSQSMAVVDLPQNVEIEIIESEENIGNEDDSNKILDSKMDFKPKNANPEELTNGNNLKLMLLPEKTSSSVKLNLYGSNFASDFESQKRNNPLSLSNGAPIFDKDEFASQDDFLKGSIMEHNLYRDVVTRVKHKQSIRFGVTASFDINYRWSVISGVTYTKLSSDLFSGSDSYYYTGEQVLHYVGIPIAIKYNVLQYNDFFLYASLGGMLEKNVSGKQTTKYTLDNEQESQKKENISISPLQISLKTSIGLQYNISQHIGIYIEPSMGYYFKNNNRIQTIYQKKRFNVDLNIGLNFRFSKQKQK